MYFLVITQFQAAFSQDENESFYRGIEWRCIGPARGGRVTAVAGVPGEPLVYYMGATGGGVWKSTDAGLSWQPISDGFFKTGSVGAIAVAPADHNVIYVGMGESPVRGNVSHGDGVYKSTDAGKTWKHVGLSDSRHIGRIRIHPQNPDLVYVAAMGHLFGANQQRGVFRSVDGGRNWEKVLYVDDKTGAVDLVMDATNPRVLYAGFWQVERTPYGLFSGGEGSALYKTTDGGDNWKELTNGLPRGIKGKIGVAVSPVIPERVWAIVEAEDGGVFRSDDAGASWRRLNDDRRWRQRAWYYSRIYTDTQDPDTIYLLNTALGKSIDGGRTFTTIQVPHGDNHDLWIAPEDNQRMINSNDGGANVSFNGGASWTRQDNQPTAQFYHVITDNQFPYRVYGAQQDNSTVSISSRANASSMDFYAVGGGESGYIAPRTDQPNIVYAGSYGGHLTRYDHLTGFTRNVHAWPDNPMGWGAAQLKYRFQWTFPIVISPRDPDILYAAANVLFKSTDSGQSWQTISGDLTTNDKSKQGPSGGPITHDNTSVEYYCTIFSVAESPLQEGLIWVGSDDGLVHVTRNGGGSWRNVTPTNMPEWGMVSIIEASPHDAATAYMAVNRYKLDDFKPYIFKTADYGRSWRLITAGIAEDAFTRTVREDPNKKGLLYAGTETGVYYSSNDGKSWKSLQLNLPVVPITDMVVKEDDLVISTQGRSFWILDDLTPLQQQPQAPLSDPIKLLNPRKTYRTGNARVSIWYLLQNDPDPQAKLTLEICDSSGQLIQSFAGADLSAQAGLNKFSWNMQYPGAREVPQAVLWSGSLRGPRAVPGTYQARLIYKDASASVNFEIVKDPRVESSQQDLEDQFDLLIKIRDRVSQAHDAVNLIRSMRQQIQDALIRAEGHDPKSLLDDLAREIRDKLTPIEEAIIQVKSKSAQDPLNFPIMLNNKLAALTGVVGSGDYPPTAQSYQVFEELSEQLQVQLDRLENVIQQDIPRFNTSAKSLDIPLLKIKKDK
ncbi:MAG: glycosyl hydrolase [Phycisphaerae bacterium SM23_30]|nr:MAG: glycosyl hydrolase [Phycisphaerae bacterium SM23_30]